MTKTEAAAAADSSMAEVRKLIVAASLAYTRGSLGAEQQIRAALAAVDAARLHLARIGDGAIDKDTSAAGIRAGARAETPDADEKLRADLQRVFEQLPLIPEDLIAEVHSYDFAEDGTTFQLMLHTAEGRTMIVTAEPGKPLAISIQ